MSEPSRVLVVNADDFGRTAGVNAGVARTYEAGIVTSASLMVRWPAAVDAAAYARRRPALSVGLHLDLGEWRWKGTRWDAVYTVVPLDDVGAVAAEVTRQLERFRELLGADPTHLDSHQHVHRSGGAVEVLARLGRELGVPVRGISGGVRHCGDFYGQSARGEPLHEQVSAKALLALLRALPSGVTELACHPAADADVPSVYATERLVEAETLCAPHVAAAVEELSISLRSFRELRAV